MCVTGVVDGMSTTNILASLARGETVASVKDQASEQPKKLRRAS